MIRCRRNNQCLAVQSQMKHMRKPNRYETFQKKTNLILHTILFELPKIRCACSDYESGKKSNSHGTGTTRGNECKLYVICQHGGKCIFFFNILNVTFIVYIEYTHKWQLGKNLTKVKSREHSPEETTRQPIVWQAVSRCADDILMVVNIYCYYFVYRSSHRRPYLLSPLFAPMQADHYRNGIL